LQGGIVNRIANSPFYAWVIYLASLINMRLSMKNHYPVSKCLLAISAAYCLALTGCNSNAAENDAQARAAEVGVLTVQPQDLQQDTELPGRTVAFQSAEIRPQAGGIIQKRIFTEGGQVKAGDLLYQIDPATYQAAFDSAQATVAKAQATFNAAKLKAKRQTELLAIQATSTQDHEDAVAAEQEAAASLALAQADLQTARINLAHTRITAPIAGRVETSAVTAGALVSANQTTALTTVQQLDPIYVDIPQSSVALLQLRNAMASGKVKAATLPVRLTLEDGSAYPLAGKLQFTGSSVDTSTGTVTLRAVVPNPSHLLLPGMYVKARLDQGVIKSAILVPQTAVTRGANSKATVLVLNKENKAEVRNVKLGRAVGQSWHVLEGLAAGEQVVVDGVAKVRPGQAVKVGAVSVQVASSPAGKQ
jgi:membrane fusion protein (multidrug efflux system)